MNSPDPVSIIVPTLNEAGNIEPLLSRIDTTMRSQRVPYEVRIIDDHSTDGTQSIVKKLRARFPVILQTKRGQKGKAYSLLEGFRSARHDVIAMIDADLQYPPEAIGDMYTLLTENSADVVVTRRTEQKTSFLRRAASKSFNLIFTRTLFGIDYDTQSGLKLFKKQVLRGMQLTPSPWSFDLEFIVRTLERNHSILSYAIPFDERHYGKAKVNVAKTTFELAKASVKLWRSTPTKRVRRSYRESIDLERAIMPRLQQFSR